MAKTCIEPGCNNPPFNEYCKYHQFRLHMKGGRLYKPAKAKKAPPKESKKRKKEHIHYLDQRKMFIQEMKDTGQYFCFISGLPFDDTRDGFNTIHHLRGRTNDYLVDKEFWILARNDKHLDVFHNSKTIDELKKEPWWDGFLARLKSKDEQSYLKIMRRIEKSGELF